MFFRCISLEKAYKSIQLKTLVLIVGMMPFALALERTGGVALAADALITLVGDADSSTLLAEHEAGLRVPLSQRAIHTVGATFPVRLAPGQRAFLLLRVQDKTFGPLSVQLCKSSRRRPGSRRLRFRQQKLSSQAQSSSVTPRSARPEGRIGAH